MNRDLRTVLFLLIVNLIGAIIYLILHLKKGDRKRGVVNAAMFLIFPIVGEVFMFLAWGMGEVIKILKDQGLNMQELSFSKKRMKLLTDGDIEKELNTVPIEEALIVADRKEKRSTFIDVLKSDDYENMMGQIHEAVENDDMEVSHYAAAFVTDSVAKFKKKEAEFRKKVDDEGSLDDLVEYVRFMEENLKPELFSIVELKVYVELMDKAAFILYEKDPDRLNDGTMTQIVELWELIGDDEKIQPWIARARVRFRNSLECFKLCARYYFRHGDRDNLKEIMNEIKRYSVPLDSEALGWIRVLKLS